VEKITSTYEMKLTFAIPPVISQFWSQYRPLLFPFLLLGRFGKEGWCMEHGACGMLAYFELTANQQFVPIRGSFQT
jgi:hypothetical protein